MYILAALPIGIAFYMVAVNPSYIKLLVTTKIGVIMLVTGISLLTFGIVWMKRIVKIDV
jgi:tight adherence protein B